MKRKIVYWGATGLVTIAALLGGFSYVTNSPEAVENFRHVGYPQQLRVLLGIAKLAGAIVLLLPRLPTLKEWAYAGFTITWIAATVAHYLAADGKSLLPVALLGCWRFVRDAPGESPRFREVDAGAGRRLVPASCVRAVRRHRSWRRGSSCPMTCRTESRRQCMRSSRDARAGRRDASCSINDGPFPTSRLFVRAW